MPTLSWLDDFFGPWILRKLGVDYPRRTVVELIEGSNIDIDVVDDPVTKATKVTFSSTGGGSGTPPGANTQVIINDGGAFGADPGMTYNKTTNVLSVAGAVSVGADPSVLSQGVNISYGYLNGINSNNSADNDQVSLVCLRDGTGFGLSTNLVQIGNGAYNQWIVSGSGRTTHIWGDDGKFNTGVGAEIASWNGYGFQFGDTTPDLGDGQGVLGLKNAAAIPTTNPTGGIVLYAESNTLKYRQPAGTIVTLTGSGGSPPGSTTQVIYNNAGAFAAHSGFTYDGAGRVTLSAGASLGGGTVATAGVVRSAYNGGSAVVLWGVKDNVGTDRSAMSFGSGNALTFGNTSMNYTAEGVGATFSFTNSMVMSIASTAVIDALSSKFGVAVPVSGSSTYSVPFRFKVAAITKSDATDLTLSAAQYECPVLHFTGAPGGPFNIIGPNTTDARFEVTNKTGSALSFKKVGGTPVVIATTKSAIVRHDGTDYIRITPDA